MAFVTFTTRDDEIVEGSEVFTVTLDVPADAATLGVRKESPDVANITIIDDNDGMIQIAILLLAIYILCTYNSDQCEV